MRGLDSLGDGGGREALVEADSDVGASHFWFCRWSFALIVDERYTIKISRSNSFNHKSSSFQTAVSFVSLQDGGRKAGAVQRDQADSVSEQMFRPSSRAEQKIEKSPFGRVSGVAMVSSIGDNSNTTRVSFYFVREERQAEIVVSGDVERECQHVVHSTQHATHVSKGVDG